MPYSPYDELPIPTIGLSIPRSNTFLSKDNTNAERDTKSSVHDLRCDSPRRLANATCSRRMVKAAEDRS